MEKILVVVDMQNDFITGSLGSYAAESIVDNVVEKIKNFDGKIFVTQDTHYPSYLDTREGHLLPVPHCIEGTPGWELSSKVTKVLSEKQYFTIKKQTFGSKALPLLIKDYTLCDEKELVIEFVGLCTDICVISNALITKAYLPEAKLVVDSFCCAGTTVDNHQAALTTLRNCHVEII